MDYGADGVGGGARARGQLPLCARGSTGGVYVNLDKAGYNNHANSPGILEDKRGKTS